MLKIKIHYFSPDAPRLKITDKGDWIDLYCAEPLELPARLLNELTEFDYMAAFAASLLLRY